MELELVALSIGWQHPKYATYRHHRDHQGRSQTSAVKRQTAGVHRTSCMVVPQLQWANHEEQLVLVGVLQPAMKLAYD